jgi:hypothetical protein
MIYEKIIPTPDLSKVLPVSFSLVLIGKTKDKVREAWKPLTDSRNVYLQSDLYCSWIKNKRGFLTIRCLETDEFICQADFDNHGVCLGHTSAIDVDDPGDISAELRAQGYRYESRFRRFTKPNTPHTFRVQRAEKGYSVSCRRLLPSKVAKSNQNH